MAVERREQRAAVTEFVALSIEPSDNGLVRSFAQQAGRPDKPPGRDDHAGKRSFLISPRTKARAASAVCAIIAAKWRDRSMRPVRSNRCIVS